MKRRIFFLVLFLSLTSILKAQNPDPLYLKDAFRKGFIMPGKDTVYYQRLFFDALPSNFKTFEKYYGWDKDRKRAKPLAGTPSYYWERIFHSKAYSRTALIKKVIGISVYGVYYPDAVAAFEQSGFKFAQEYNAEFIKQLRLRTEPEIVSVWKFYFDYPSHQLRKKVYDKLCRATLPNDKKMVTLITRGYKQAEAKWAAHH